MRRIAIRPKEGFQVLLPSSPKKGQGEYYMDRDDEHDKGINKEGVDFYIYGEDSKRSV